MVWRSERTKHQMFQDMVRQAHQNAVPFWYVLADSWYTNSDNINLILGFTTWVRSNLTLKWLAPSRSEQMVSLLNQYAKVQPGTVLTAYIRSVPTPVAICGDVLPTSTDQSANFCCSALM